MQISGHIAEKQLKLEGLRFDNLKITGQLLSTWMFLHYRPSSSSSRPSRRDFEDGEDLFERDLDVEELFGWEYEPLDEREVIDNGDLFVGDLDNEELLDENTAGLWWLQQFPTKSVDEKCNDWL